MINLDFDKYEATGNDFVILNNLSGDVPKLSPEQIQFLCHRKKGIGSDGLIIMSSTKHADYKMEYFNSDGHEAEMCGNGTRAISDCYHRKTSKDSRGFYKFETFLGIKEALIDYNDEFEIFIKMGGFEEFDKLDISKLYNSHLGSLYCNTGVPHCVYEVKDADQIDFEKIIPKIRQNKMFHAGTNINFFSSQNESYRMRTFERGVEAETDSCGTGAMAVAWYLNQKKGVSSEVILHVNGGKIKVKFDEGFNEVFLCGKARKCFEGSICLS